MSVSLSAGMLAAEAAFSTLTDGTDMTLYWDNLKKSWIWKELYAARNYRPVSNSNAQSLSLGIYYAIFSLKYY